MATPRKLPSGQWRARGYYKDPVTGKVDRPSFTADTKAEAARMAAEWEADKERLSRSHGLTVGECVTRYISAKRAALSPSTLNGYLWMQEHRYSEISGFTIDRLSDEILQRYVSDLSLRVSPKSVRNAYGLLIASVGMFSDRVFHVTMPARRPVERHIPTDADIKLLMEMAYIKMRLAIALAASGTMRLGEIAALKYRDVLREQSAVYVHADIVKGPDGWVYKENPKTASSVRIIPLPAKLMEMIGEGDPDDFIYPVNPGTIEKNFCKLRDKLGLKCRFHDLRHYAASIMHALGIPDVYIMERGGWKSDTVLKDIYRNSLSDQSAKFQQAANDHFSSLL